jgi:hypothetical protein
MRSPASELGVRTGDEVRKVRSAELHGAKVLSPVSGLGSESAGGFGNGKRLGSVEVDGSAVHTPYQGGIAMNF